MTDPEREPVDPKGETLPLPKTKPERDSESESGSQSEPDTNETAILPDQADAGSWKARLRARLARHEEEREERPGGSLPSPMSNSRFDVLRELGRGGMGVVLECEDTVLGRRVALKVLLAGRFASDEALERFQIEARAAARLRHPNIVGVHEVGEEEGRHFMVMDLIEGEGLERILRREGALGPQTSAQIALKLAVALAYAHERSILHRDLKPANVLISPDGEPLLTDFGLAKEVERTGGGPTTSGHVMGTPAYMSPEQARGLAVDRRTDVYSLGATLYEMLTGKPPFTGMNVASILTRVLQEDPEAPSKLREGLDRDLETICLKCLEKEPQLRYQSADELAEDLDRFLHHQTIRARRPTVRERASKWLRRNSVLARALTITVGIALAVLLVSGGAFLNQVSHERNRFRQAANEANAALNMLVFEVRDELGDVSNPEVREVRRRLLSSAVKRLEALQELQQRGDTKSTQQACEAYRQIGDLARSAGETSEAIKLYEKALSLAQELVKATPDLDEAHWEYAACLLKIVDIRIHQGDWEGSLAPAQQAVKILSDVGGADVTVALSRLGSIHQALGRPGRALEIFEGELMLARKASAVYRNDRRSLRAVERALLDVGEARQAQGDLSGALEAFEEAIPMARAYYEKDPEKTSTLRDLRTAVIRAGTIHMDQGNLTKARAAFGEAATLSREWVRRDPDDVTAAEQILSTLGRLGDAAMQQGDMADARHAFEEMEQRARELRRKDPKSEEIFHSMLAAIGRVAHVKKSQGDLPGALANLEEIQRLAEEDLRAHPDRITSQRSVSSGLIQLGDLFVAQGNLPAARQALERCTSLRRKLFAERPKDATARTELVDALTELIEIYELLGKHPEALESGAEAIALCRAILESEPTHDGTRRALSVALDRVGRVRLFRRETQLALEAYREGLQVSKTLTENDPTSVQAKRFYATAHANTGTALRQIGKLDQAQKHYEDALSLRKALMANSEATVDDERKLSICKSHLADIQLARGAIEPAEAMFREVLTAQRARAAADRTNASAKRDVYVTLVRLAEVRQAQKDWEAAVRLYDEAADSRRQDWRAQTQDAVARKDLFNALLRRAKLEHTGSRYERAIAAYSELIQVQRAIISDEPTDPEKRRTLVTLTLKIAECHQGLEAWPAMIEHLELGAEAAATLAKMAPRYTSMLGQIKGFVANEKGRQAIREGTVEPTTTAERALRAQALLRRKDYPQALANYEIVLADPQHRENLDRPHLYRGALAAAGAGDHERALEWLAEDVGRRRAALDHLETQRANAPNEQMKAKIAAAQKRVETYLEKTRSEEPAFAVLRALPAWKTVFE